jgi:hypothetical protein
MNNTKDRILDFINRRFKQDCNWTSGNCYYFAVILRERFADYDDGWIMYEPIDGHFLFKYDGNYYDHTGVVNLREEQKQKVFYFDDLKQIDRLLYDIIVRDCIR